MISGEFMFKYSIFNSEKLLAEIDLRSKQVLKKFRKITLSKITHEELKHDMNFVNSYWNDQFRPALTSFSCEAVGGKKEVVIDASIMVTLIAAGMGIHDDIIDHSDHKHFRKTLLGSQSFEHSIVVGDFLIVKALSSMRNLIKKKIPTEKIFKIIQAFESSFLEICEGEFMEISFKQKLNSNLDSYQEILWKFAADTEVCAKIGSILGNGSEKEIGALAKFGRLIGFNHRLMDDIKDCINLEGSLPHRLKFESIPLPILHSAQYSKQNFNKIKAIMKHPITPSDVGTLVELCEDSLSFALVYDIAFKNFNKAKKQLHLLKSNKAVNILRFMVEQSLSNIAKYCTYYKLP